MRNGVLTALALVAALVGGPAAAQTPAGNEQGIYLGGSVGYSQYQSACENLLIPCDDNTTAGKGFAGYRWNKYWAAELGAGYLGKATGSGDISGFGTVNFKQESYGGDISALGSVPVIGGLSVFGRVGVYMARTVVDITSSADPSSNSSQAKTQSGFTYGAGLGLQMGFLGLRAEWQRYDNIGVPGFQKDDLDLFMLSGLIQF